MTKSVKVFRRYSLLSGLSIICVTAILVLLYRQQAIDHLAEDAENLNVALAQSISNSIWPKYSTYLTSIKEEDGDILRARPETQSILESLTFITAGLPVLKVKIYNLQGRTIFSSELDQIGEDKSNSDGFVMTAMQGKPSSRISYREKFNSFSGVVSNRYLLESYLPIVGKNGNWEGLFELYSDVSPMRARIDRITVFLTLVSIGVLGLLYGILSMFVWRAIRLIERQYTDLQQKEAVLNDRSRQLEKEVKERSKAEESLQEAHAQLEILIEKRTQEAAASEAHLKEAIASFPQAFVLWDKEDRLELCNELYRELYPDIMDAIIPGISFEELVRLTVENGQIELGDIPGEEWVATRLEQHYSGSKLVERRLKDGRNILASENRTANGDIVGVRIDITDLRVLEDQLVSARRLESLGKLTGGVAHEFNNLLSVIGGYTDQIIKHRDTPARVDEALNAIAEAVSQGTAVTRQMLSVGRRQLTKTQLIPLNDVVMDLSNLLPPLLGDRNELEYDLAEIDFQADIDTAQVTQALMNLCINARDAMISRGTLSISTYALTTDKNTTLFNSTLPAGQYTCIAVTDTGHGMEEETVHKIFEPFFTTKEIGAGTGLGMALVHSVMQDANGYINVQSVINKGTTFTLYFPVATSVEGSDSAQQQANLKALIVDEREGLAELVAMSLEDIGYQSVLASEEGSMAEALTAQGSEYDLVVVSTTLQEIDGIEFSKKLLSENPDLLVFYLSPNASVGLSDQRRIGDDANIVQKPFDPDFLADRIVNERNF